MTNVGAIQGAYVRAVRGEALAFSQLADYLRIIRTVGGYFVYDPQTKLAVDQLKTDLS